jgi:hypothetical protein
MALLHFGTILFFIDAKYDGIPPYDHKVMEFFMTLGTLGLRYPESSLPGVFATRSLRYLHT